MHIETEHHTLTVEDLWVRADADTKGLAHVPHGCIVVAYVVRYKQSPEQVMFPDAVMGRAHWPSIVGIIPLYAETSEWKIVGGGVDAR